MLRSVIDSHCVSVSVCVLFWYFQQLDPVSAQPELPQASEWGTGRGCVVDWLCVNFMFSWMCVRADILVFYAAPGGCVVCIMQVCTFVRVDASCCRERVSNVKIYTYVNNLDEYNYKLNPELEKRVTFKLCNSNYFLYFVLVAFFSFIFKWKDIGIKNVNKIHVCNLKVKMIIPSNRLYLEV